MPPRADYERTARLRPAHLPAGRGKGGADDAAKGPFVDFDVVLHAARLVADGCNDGGELADVVHLRARKMAAPRRPRE